MGGGGGGVEKWRLKLTSAKVEVEVEAELGNNNILYNTFNPFTTLYNSLQHFKA